jgi:Uma2 family endonuclease
MAVTPAEASVEPDVIQERVVLNHIQWSTYEQLLEDLGDDRCRHVYDRGTLEIMALSQDHERIRCVLGRLLEALTEELGLAILSLGSTTMRRRDLQRGIEPDECYYIQNEGQVRRKRKISWRKDPPPDLAIEVDITRSSLRRMEVHAALGVPEIWRWDGARLLIYWLGENGQYTESSRSRAIPDLDVGSELTHLVEQRYRKDENSLVRECRDWVRALKKKS